MPARKRGADAHKNGCRNREFTSRLMVEQARLSAEAAIEFDR
jgi:hypothetical protein